MNASQPPKLPRKSRRQASCRHEVPPNGLFGFKWIRQHLGIKKFLGTGEKAAKMQIWRAIAIYVLIAIVKKESQLKYSLYTCLQILSVSVFKKTQVLCALQPDDLQNQPVLISSQ